MPPTLTPALNYIINALTSLYLILFLLRLLLPLLRADFRNPLAQAVLKLTAPVVTPLRRIVPSLGRLDVATLLAAFVIQCLAVAVMMFVLGITPLMSIGSVLVTAVVKLIGLTINIFIFAIFIRIIVSWVAPGIHNPIVTLVATISEPILGRFRRLIPPLGGFDLSPVFALILLTALKIVVYGYLKLPV